MAASGTWVSGGTLPTGIIEIASSEIGAGVLLQDGRAFYAGANQHTALYTRPALASGTGTWAMGPDFPNDSMGRTVGCKDSPACLLTNGKVLIAAGPVNGQRDDFLAPNYMFEFDGSALHRVSDPGNAGDVPFIGRMLLLPTGQVLFAAQTNDIYVYNYLGCVDAAARPQITSAPATVRPFFSYTLHGRLLNGLSQSVGYGDDASAATNYTFRWPIWDERIYNMLIGSLADGPLWVWGPHGPVPVDPWGPKVAKQAKTATQQIIKGLSTLHELGSRVDQTRETTVAAQPLATDDPYGSAQIGLSRGEGTAPSTSTAKSRAGGTARSRATNKAKPSPRKRAKG